MVHNATASVKCNLSLLLTALLENNSLPFSCIKPLICLKVGSPCCWLRNSSPIKPSKIFYLKSLALYINNSWHACVMVCVDQLQVVDEFYCMDRIAARKLL